MKEKSNKPIMRKQIAIIFIILFNLATMSACGVKGSLYQTPEQEKTSSKNINDKTAQHNQQ